MTDTITPASLRAHADYVFETGVDASVAHALRAMADEMEAESARDEETYVLELANVIARAEQDCTLDELFHWRREQVTEAALAVLDRLAADGRLLPEGGTVLTADDSPCGSNSVVLGSCVLAARHDGLHTNGAHSWGIDTPPAVSVPDSGPRTWTSLDQVPHDVVDLIDREGYEWQHNWATTRWNGVWSGSAESSAKYGPFTEVVPDSGPDGTPEKPWPTWQDVPEGVKYWSADPRKRNLPRVNRGGKRYVSEGAEGSDYLGVGSEEAIRHQAPFVRVDGDKA